MTAHRRRPRRGRGRCVAAGAGRAGAGRRRGGSGCCVRPRLSTVDTGPRCSGFTRRSGAGGTGRRPVRSARSASCPGKGVSMSVPGATEVARAVWWLVLLRGVLAVLFGLFALFAPGSALLALVFVFGAYAVLDGITAVVAGLRHRREEAHWVWHVVEGVISIVAGIIAFAWPGVTALVILYLVAFWSIFTGISEIMESFAMRRRGSRMWAWVLAAGILGVLLGIVLVLWPGAGLLTLLWLVGIYAVVFGAIIIGWALRRRRAVSAA